eukprot:COSAG02_NODE_10287_length_1977_cov_3.133120_1_plen_246_part_00
MLPLTTSTLIRQHAILLAGVLLACALRAVNAGCGKAGHDASKCCELGAFGGGQCRRTEFFQRDCCRNQGNSGCLDGYVYSRGSWCFGVNDYDICCVPPDIDCEGSWSECTSDCVYSTWTEAVAQSGQGEACPSVQPSCAAGEGDCPPDIDCEGSWSDCTSQCVSAWVETVAQSGQGEACPSVQPSCAPGEGGCPMDCAACVQKCLDQGNCSRFAWDVQQCACTRTCAQNNQLYCDAPGTPLSASW